MAISDSSLMKMTRTKLKLSDLNPHLMCVLCGGYYIDATTIVECLHSFCRSCIVKHLEGSKYCPICEVQVHKTKPLINIRPDKTLQDIVYKLVPGLFANGRCYKDQAKGEENGGSVTDGEMHNRRVFYQERPHYIKPDDSESVGEVSRERVRMFVEGDNVTFSLNYHSGPSPVPIDDMYKEVTSIQGELRYFRCPSGVSIHHLKRLLKAKYELRGNNYMINIFLKDMNLSDDYTLLDISYIFLWVNEENLSMTFKVYECPITRRRRRCFGGVNELPAHCTPPSILQSRLGMWDDSEVKNSMSEGKRHLRSDVEKKKREPEDIPEVRLLSDRELRSHDERKKEKDTKNNEVKHKEKKKEGKNSEDKKRDNKNPEEKKKKKEKDKEKDKDKEDKCHEEKRKEKDDDEDEDEDERGQDKEAKEEENMEVRKEGENKRKWEGECEEKRKREKRDDRKESDLDTIEEVNEEACEETVSKEVTTATASEPAPTEEEVSVSISAIDGASASASASASDSTSALEPTLEPNTEPNTEPNVEPNIEPNIEPNSGQDLEQDSGQNLEQVSTKATEDKKETEEAAMETEGTPVTSESTTSHENRATSSPKDGENSEVQLQISESGVMSMSPIPRNSEDVVRTMEERVCTRVTRRSSITGPPPRDEGTSVRVMKKRGPKPKKDQVQNADGSQSQKGRSKSTKPYKSIRHAPVIWHPSIPRDKLRPSLIKSPEEQRKPAKFFKLRNRTRALENSLNETNPVTAKPVVEEAEEEEERPRHESVVEETQAEPQAAHAGTSNDGDAEKIEEDKRRLEEDKKRSEEREKRRVEEEDKGVETPSTSNEDPKASATVEADNSNVARSSVSDRLASLRGSRRNYGAHDKDDRSSKTVGSSSSNLLTNPFIPNSNHFLFSDVTLPPNSGNLSKSAEQEKGSHGKGGAGGSKHGVNCGSGSSCFESSATNGVNCSALCFLDPCRLVYPYHGYPLRERDSFLQSTRLSPFGNMNLYNPVGGFQTSVPPCINHLSNPHHSHGEGGASAKKNKGDSTKEKNHDCSEPSTSRKPEERERRKRRRRVETETTNYLQMRGTGGESSAHDVSNSSARRDDHGENSMTPAPAKRKRDERGSRDKDKKDESGGKKDKPKDDKGEKEKEKDD